MGTEPARRLRAYRFTLDPTGAQLGMLAQHAGDSRWAYNHANDLKRDALRRQHRITDELVTLGWAEATARAEARRRCPVPNAMAVAARWRLYRDDPRADPWRGGICPWHTKSNTYAFTSAFRDCDQAWKNWADSLTGKRAGPRMGRPRRKKKGRARDSFRLHHDVKRPTIRLDGYRRLRMPTIGSVRLHESGKRLARAVARGGRVQSVTVSRGGRRWYASVLVDEPDLTPGRETQGGATGHGPAGPSHQQRRSGVIGVDLGVSRLATLSTGEVVRNPRHLEHARRRVERLERERARRQGPDHRTGRQASSQWLKTNARLARAKRQVAVERESFLHQLTKHLATRYAVVAVEDLNIVGMTRSAKGTVNEPGRGVRAKSGLNRAILDVAPGKLRRQLEYKTAWYGSTLAVCNRWYPSSKTCSACGAVKAKLGLSERVFVCDSCGYREDRDLNAARNIAAVAVPVASGGGDT